MSWLDRPRAQLVKSAMEESPTGGWVGSGPAKRRLDRVRLVCGARSLAGTGQLGRGLPEWRSGSAEGCSVGAAHLAYRTKASMFAYIALV